MASTRKVAIALVLALLASAAWLEFLPRAPDMVLAPTVALVATLLLATLRLPLLPALPALAATGGTLALVTFGLLQTPSQSLALLAAVPLCVAICHVHPRWVLATTIGTAVIALLLDHRGAATFPVVLGEARPAWRALSGLSYTDALGQLFTWGWVTLAAVGGFEVLHAEWRLMELQSTIRDFDRMIDRDHNELVKIADILADPELSAVFSGHGLAVDRLNIATRLGRNRVLLGCIHGEPIETLAAAWALRACALSGTRNPETLLNIADSELRRMGPSLEFEWLAISEESGRRMKFYPEGSESAIQDMPRRFTAAIGQRSSAACIEALLLQPPRLTQTLSRDGGGSWTAQLLRLAIHGLSDLLAMFAPLLPLYLAHDAAAVALVPVLLAPAATHWWLRLRKQQLLEELAYTRELAEGRIDCQEDLRTFIQGTDAGFLPSRVELGSIVARCHRVGDNRAQGDFADLVAGREDQAFVIAGAVAGEGIGPRFLALEAQFILRHELGRSEDFERAHRIAERRLERDARRIGFALEFELGYVHLDGRGHARGRGALSHMVVARSPGHHAQVRDHARLNELSRLYVTTGIARPGPEEVLSPVDRRTLLETIVSLIQQGTLPDDRARGVEVLAQALFNGITIPRSGVLVELSSAASAHHNSVPWSTRSGGPTPRTLLAA